MPYYQFKDEDGRPFGSFEVWHLPTGWYWWSCFPGCMPDSETPNGPFITEQEAIDDAQDN